MNTDDYLKRARNIHKRMTILRGQIDDHLKTAHPNVTGKALGGLVERLGEIADEARQLDEEAFGPAPYDEA